MRFKTMTYGSRKNKNFVIENRSNHINVISFLLTIIYCMVLRI